MPIAFERFDLNAAAALVVTSATLLLPASLPALAQSEATAEVEVNPLGYDKGVWLGLLRDHGHIRRTIHHSETGLTAITESDDPKVAAAIIDHAMGMKARMQTGSFVRRWDPVFAELFDNHEAVSIEVTETPRGVRISETGTHPDAIRFLRSHALGLSDFVRGGFEFSPLDTPMLPTGAPLPADELTIGGIEHRFILEVPSLQQIEYLKGVETPIERIVQCGAADSKDGLRELAASTGLGFDTVAFPDAAILDDDTIEAARKAVREIAQEESVVAIICTDAPLLGVGWAAYRALDEGIPVAQAMNEARAMHEMDPVHDALAEVYLVSRAAEAK